MELYKKINENQPAQYLIGIGIITFVSFICYLFIDFIGYHVVALILLLAVSILAMFFEIFPIVTIAVLSALIWNFFFIQPQYTFKISTPADALFFLMYFMIAVMNAVFTTKIRKAESTAQKRKERGKTLELYNTLLNSLSHELKTPIATIIGSIDTLKENTEKLSQQNKEDLYSEIEIAGNRLNRQVKNLLNMSRLESDFIQLQLNWYDINELIYSVIKHNKGDALNHHINFYPNDDLPLFQFDAALVEQILHNILHNALQYTPIGSVIEIKVSYTAEILKMEIKDNGKGFPKDEIKRVFDKFYRLPNSVTGGTGLGLSIAQGFVKAHNGKIYLKNRSSGGAKFTVEIPVALADPKNYQNE
ncbi:sensor histidine kinase [Salegentibacter sediminis]|uniref:sensor histidine kinase n=1 Tax=Salegentibacter sediminis TaxID=1930251 RepID=UPI000DA11799|nr:ATP-binding protein [Salegentibacter sediminis]